MTHAKRPPLKPNLKGSKSVIKAEKPKPLPAKVERKASINTNPFKPPRSSTPKGKTEELKSSVKVEESKEITESEEDIGSEYGIFDLPNNSKGDTSKTTDIHQEPTSSPHTALAKQVDDLENEESNLEENRDEDEVIQNEKLESKLTQRDTAEKSIESDYLSNTDLENRRASNKEIISNQDPIDISADNSHRDEATSSTEETPTPEKSELSQSDTIDDEQPVVIVAPTKPKIEQIIEDDEDESSDEAEEAPKASKASEAPTASEAPEAPNAPDAMSERDKPKYRNRLMEKLNNMINDTEEETGEIDNVNLITQETHERQNIDRDVKPKSEMEQEFTPMNDSDSSNAYSYTPKQSTDDDDDEPTVVIREQYTPNKVVQKQSSETSEETSKLRSGKPPVPRQPKIKKKKMKKQKFEEDDKDVIDYSHLYSNFYQIFNSFIQNPKYFDPSVTLRETRNLYSTYISLMDSNILFSAPQFKFEAAPLEK